MSVSSRPSRLAAALLAAGLLATTAAAQNDAQRLLILDQDAHAVSDTVAGALFNADLSAAAWSEPQVEIAADGGASQFQFVSGIAISPWDGSVYISDLGLEFGTLADGAILRHEQGSGTITTLAGPGDPNLRDPFALAFTEDGTLLVVDWESDPSGLGPDWVGGVGHGGVYSVDLNTGALTLLSDGTNHDIPGIDPSETAFQDPIGIAWDPVSDLIYIADFSADGDNDGFFNGSVFSLDPATGQLRVVSAYWNFAAPTAIAVRPNGRPLLVDSLLDDSALFEIDLGVADVTDNVTFITSGASGEQYALLEGVTVDAADNIWVVDIGEWDDTDMTWFTEPGVYRVDESQRDIDPDFFDLDNAIRVVQWVDGADTILSPVNLAAVPHGVVDSITPRSVAAPTAVVMEGANLHPSLEFDFDGSVSVSGVSSVPGRDLGTALQMTLTPICSLNPASGVTPRHPFGGGVAFADVIDVESAGNMASPFSVRGDANRDGLVDGLDLGILGRSFGADVCDVGLFVNDADFSDDNLIDGIDLTILMTYFGTNP